MFYCTYNIVKMGCESDSSDDYSCEPKEKEEVSRDTDFSDVSDDKIEVRCVNEWTYITDLFLDQCKTPLMEFQGGVKISPTILLLNVKSHVNYFEIFFEKIVLCLYEWTNGRVDVYFEDTEYKIIMLYGLK